jgi:5-methylcytosine-specific restriction endonuclease McrA
LLIEQVKKERFATGRKARQAPAEDADESSSRHIPDAIKREVFERDCGRCTFTDEQGRRCAETGALEFDHRDGFARTRLHRADRIRLLCRPHNRHAAERMYGRPFMERARASVDRLAAGPGTPSG